MLMMASTAMVSPSDPATASSHPLPLVPGEKNVNETSTVASNSPTPSSLNQAPNNSPSDLTLSVMETSSPSSSFSLTSPIGQHEKQVLTLSSASSSSSSSSPPPMMFASSSPPQLPSSSDLAVSSYVNNESQMGLFQRMNNNCDFQTVSRGNRNNSRCNNKHQNHLHHMHSHRANHYPYTKGNHLNLGVSRCSPDHSSPTSSSPITAASVAGVTSGAFDPIVSPNRISGQTLKNCLDQLLNPDRMVRNHSVRSGMMTTTTTSVPIKFDPLEGKETEHPSLFQQPQQQQQPLPANSNRDGTGSTLTGFDPKELLLAAAIILKHQQEQQQQQQQQQQKKACVPVACKERTNSSSSSSFTRSPFLSRHTHHQTTSSSSSSSFSSSSLHNHSSSATMITSAAPGNSRQQQHQHQRGNNTCRCSQMINGSDHCVSTLNQHQHLNRLLMHHPIQMKAADNENRNERKLFVGMLSKKMSESEVRHMFSPHGLIEECTILRDVTGSSKGCCFITFSSRASAVSAIKSLHQKQTLDGCTSPLVVKFADTQRDKEAKKAKLLPNPMATPVTPTVPVVTPAASLTPGPAFPVHAMPTGAAGHHPAAGHTNPYLSVLTLAAAQHQQQLASAAVALQHQIASLAATAPLNPLCLATNPVLNELYRAMGQNPATVVKSQQQQQQAVASDLFQRQQQHLPQLTGQLVRPQPAAVATTTAIPIKETVPKQTEGPDGANLFIYHLPVEFTDTDLAGIFRPFGNVISAKVFIDKRTQLSKCFGFVSFDSVSAAKTAISAMNGFRIGNKRLKVQQKKSKDKPYNNTGSSWTTNCGN